MHKPNISSAIIYVFVTIMASLYFQSLAYAKNFAHIASSESAEASFLLSRLDNASPRFSGSAPLPSYRATEFHSPILGLYDLSKVSHSVASVAAVRYAIDNVEASDLLNRIIAHQLRPDQQATGSINRTRSRQDELFQSVAIPFGKLPALARMVSVEKDIAGGFLKNCATRRCENSRDLLVKLLDDQKQRGFVKLVDAVNSTVNKLIRYQPDRTTYRTLDFWANPSTTLNTGAGDCEDYAILKMAVLAEAGIPRSSMSIVILRDQRRDVFHAVLSIRTSQGYFVLDNAQSRVLRDTDVPEYLPLFSVSDGRGYIYGKRTGSSKLLASLGSLDSVAPGEGRPGQSIFEFRPMAEAKYGESGAQ